MHERDILLAALEKTQPDERAAYLAQACGADAELRGRVEALVRAAEAQDSFLEHPAVETELLSRETEGLRRERAEHDELNLDFLRPSDDPQSLGRLGSYEVVEVIGRGGMGVVLRARDTKLNRVVAIKVLAPELASNPTARKRFQREAHAAAAVVHQHIVTIHAVDEDRLPYLVMECIVGQSLQEKLDREGNLQLIEILRIGQQVAAGLAAAHTHGLIHRDVKPANILLENGVERVRITDFGLARAVDDVGMTRTGEVAGTPQYMSPEQAQGLPLDSRSDLFSFGCVLYAMCTGRPPFRAETAFATARRVCEDAPRPIREINPEIPEWLLDIVDRLLKKDPAERLQSAKEVAELLGQYLAHAQQPAIVPLPGKELVSAKRKPGVRRRQWSVALVMFLLVLALVVGLTDASGMTSFVPTVIRIVRGEGTLVIEVADPTVKISLDGEALSIRGAGLQELRLLPGQYRLHATKDGQPIKDEVVTISRDGRKVVTVTREGLALSGSPDVAPAVERPVGELQLLAKLDGHTDTVRGVAFLPDCKRIVSVGRDRKVQIWDLKSRNLLSTLPVEGYLRDADVSADGRLVAIVSNDRGEAIAQVWDLEKRELVRQLPQDFNYVHCIRFSPDAARLVTSGNPPRGFLWDLTTDRELRRLDLGDTPLTQAATFSPDGRLIALGAVGRVRLFDAESGAVLSDIRLPDERHVNDLEFTATGKGLVCGQVSGNIHLIDVDARQVKKSLKASNAPVVRLRLLGNDRFILTTCFDATLRLLDLERGAVIASAATEKGTNERLAISPDGRHAITASGEDWDNASRTSKRNGDYALRLWQLPESVWPKVPTPAKESAAVSSVVPTAKPSPDDLKLLEKLNWHTNLVRAVAFLPDGRRVVSVGQDNMVRIWDMANRSVLGTLPLGGSLATADVSPDGRRVAVVLKREGKAVGRVWDIEKREFVCEFAPDLVEGPNCIRFSPDGTRLTTSGVSLGHAVLWDAATGMELGRFNLGDAKGVHPAAFSPDGRLLALGAVGRVRMFDVESRDVVADVRLLNPWNVWDLQFAPSGKTLATGQGGGHVSLVDVDSRSLIKTLQVSVAPIHGLRFHGSDRFLLSCSSDALLRICDLKHERVVAQAATGNGTNHGLFVSPDGRQVITAGGKEWDDASRSIKDHGDYALRLWQLPESVWPTDSTLDLILPRSNEAAGDIK